MKCPKCGIINTETAIRCQCGFAFSDMSLPKPAITSTSSPQNSLLRWILVLPAALAASIGIQLGIALMNLLSGSMAMPKFWLQLVNSGLSGYFFVFAGAKTAPGHHLTVGIVLAVTFAILVSVVITYLVSSSIRSSEPLWWMITCGIVSVVAAVVACIKLTE